MSLHWSSGLIMNSLGDMFFAPDTLGAAIKQARQEICRNWDAASLIAGGNCRPWASPGVG